MVVLVLLRRSVCEGEGERERERKRGQKVEMLFEKDLFIK
jgi:hypothetical protein